MSTHLSVPLSGHAGSYAYLSTDPGSETAVIFVHGFWGDAWSTWEDFQGLVDEEVRWHGMWAKTDLYFFEYRGASNFVMKSAQDLSEFLLKIYPEPESRFFVVSSPRSFVPKDYLASARGTATRYRRLVLVGHSLGAVVLRQAVTRQLKAVRNRQLPLDSVPAWVRDGELRLFAPAHRGFRPSNWKAMMLKAPILRSCLAIAPVYWRAYPDLQPDSALIEDLQRDTKELLLIFPTVRGLRATSLFGANEDVVEPLEYEGDLGLAFEDGRGHGDICKPDVDFSRPFRFVEYGLDPRVARV